jgi:hypothetical protein
MQLKMEAVRADLTHCSAGRAGFMFPGDVCISDSNTESGGDDGVWVFFTISLRRIKSFLETFLPLKLQALNRLVVAP